MRLTVDLRELDNLRITLQQAKAQYPKSVVGAALKDAANPMLIAAKQEAPVGKKLRYKARNVANNGSYDRGGATRRDLRLKVITYKGGSIGVLIGVSKKKGKVGWRTPFVTLGSKNNRKNDFLTRAFDRTFELVANRLGKSLGVKFEAYVKRRTK